MHMNLPTTCQTNIIARVRYVHDIVFILKITPHTNMGRGLGLTSRTSQHDQGCEIPSTTRAHFLWLRLSTFTREHFGVFTIQACFDETRPLTTKMPSHLMTCSRWSTEASDVKTGKLVATQAAPTSRLPTTTALPTITRASLRVRSGLSTVMRGMSALPAVNIGSVQKDKRK